MWKICSSKSALQESTDTCWLVVCRPRLKPRSDSVEIRQRVHSYVTDDRLRIRYSAWQSGTSTMQGQWGAETYFPSNPYSEPDVHTYGTVLTDVLRTFLRQPWNFSPDVVRLMDNKVPLRSDAQRTNILDTIWAFTNA